MSHDEKSTKPKYESPILVPLGGMAKGAGVACSAGSSANTDCVAGGGANPGFCQAGTTATPGYCTAGITAQTACSDGNSAVTAACNAGTFPGA